jgi:hypothetical protein
MGQVGWGICNSWVKQPLGLRCWGGASLGGRSYAKVGRWKTTISCLSWHMLLCGEDAHTISIRMLWVKCTTSAECKSIRIAMSSVMDGWNGRCLAQCQFWFTKWFLENAEWCRTEYSEGTVVARVWIGVLAGYCWGIIDGHDWLTWFMNEKGFSPFLEILLKLFYKHF